MFRAVSLVDDLDSNRYIGLRFNLFHTWLNLFTCQPSTSSSMLSRHPVASLAVAAVLVTSPKGELRETWANFFTLRHNNIFIFGSFFQNLNSYLADPLDITTVKYGMKHEWIYLQSASWDQLQSHPNQNPKLPQKNPPFHSTQITISPPSTTCS